MTIILDEHGCIEKVERPVNNTATYGPHRGDPIGKLEKKINKTLKKLQDMQKTTKQEC